MSETGLQVVSHCLFELFLDFLQVVSKLWAKPTQGAFSFFWVPFKLIKIMISEKNRRIFKINKQQSYTLEWQSSCRTKSVLIAFLHVCDAIAQKYSTKAFKFHVSPPSYLEFLFLQGTQHRQRSLPRRRPSSHHSSSWLSICLHCWSRPEVLSQWQWPTRQNCLHPQVRHYSAPVQSKARLTSQEVHEFVTFNVEDLP